MSQARQPRAALIVNGASIAVIEAQVKLSKDHKSDTASIEAALDDLPPGLDANFWSTANDISMQVIISAGAGAGIVKMFDGKTDHIEIDFGTRVLKVSGRDKGAKLIDKKITKKHINKKPHEVVQDLASEGGIATQIDQVDDKHGKIVQIDYAGLIHRMSNWAGIQLIADRYGMAAYMTQGTLYFKKADEKLPIFRVIYKPPTASSYAEGNFIGLTVERNCVLGRPVKSHVHSWSHKEKKLIEHTEEEPGVGDPLEYHDHHPNLTKDQAKKRAKGHLDAVTKHEFSISLDMPGDPTINARYMLQLSGTGTAFDQQYEVQSVDHSISTDKGYRMKISSKSKSKKRGKK